MKTLNESPELLRQTIDLLNGDPAQINAQSGIDLINEWTEPLLTMQMTKPIAEKLGQLKMLLEAETINEQAIRTLLSELAHVTKAISDAPEAEGDVESLTNELSEKLQQVGKPA